MHAKCLELLFDTVKLKKWFLSEWGELGKSGNVTVLMEVVRGKTMPKGFRSFFHPGHGTQYL